MAVGIRRKGKGKRQREKEKEKRGGECREGGGGRRAFMLNER